MPRPFPRPLPALAALGLLSACSWSLPGVCPATPGQAPAASVVGGTARAPFAWQNPGATDALTQESAVASGDVFLADASGNALPGLHATTATSGAYDLRRVPATFGVQVVLRKTRSDGRWLVLRTLTRTTPNGTTADLDVATTILTDALLKGRSGLPGPVDAGSFQHATELIYNHLGSDSPLDVTDEAGMIARFQSWLAADADLKTAYDQLAHDVAASGGSADDLAGQLRGLAGQTSPSGLAALASPSPGASPGSPAPTASASGGASPDAGASAAAGASPAPSPAPSDVQGIVSTYVGNTGIGDLDGDAATAQFNNIRGIAADDAGNLYVAEGNGHRIRQVAPDGTVTTLAGQGVDGFADGHADLARFGNLAGVCMGPPGVLYVADLTNQRIRKVDLNATGHPVTTLAGDGGQGHADGPGPTARFNNPANLVYDARTGNLYVIEYSGLDVRQIAPDGTVSTLAGQYGKHGYADGPGDQALFFEPAQAALDPGGKLYVADSVNCMIRMVDPVDPTHPVTTFAGTRDPGLAPDSVPTGGYFEAQGAAAQFFRPGGIAFDPRGFFVVADTSNYRVRRLALDGTTRLIAGDRQPGHTDGTGGDARFNLPGPVAVGPGGAIYVVDGNGGTMVRKIL